MIIQNVYELTYHVLSCLDLFFYHDAALTVLSSFAIISTRTRKRELVV